jgi:hypothetical protein
MFGKCIASEENDNNTSAGSQAFPSDSEGNAIEKVIEPAN